LGRAELRFVSNAEQTMGMPALSMHRWTSADVRALMDEARHWPRYELLDGELLVTNAPTLAHQWAVTELAQLVGNYCKRSGIGMALVSPADIELAPESIMQPDVFVVPDRLVPADGAMRWPAVTELLLAVEVLSPSTMREDRVRKRDFYLANHVGECWIVDLDGRVIERWTPERERPDIKRDELEWRPGGASESFLLDVAKFFADNPGLKRGG
jgi:Uma2 family endonuclease